jgi:TctA family transporter
MEENFRRALVLSHGNFATFFTRPISGTMFALVGVFLLWRMVTLALAVTRSAIGASR